MQATPGTRRIGILIDRYDQPGWVRDLAIRLAANWRTASISLILSEETQAARPGFAHRISNLALGVIQRAESKLLSKSENASFHREDIRQEMPQAELLPLSTIVERVEGQEPLDLILVLGMSRVRRDLIGLPRLGVWTIFHSGSSAAADRHTGFWEVLRGDDHTTLRICKLGMTSAQDRLLHSRSFNTEFYWLKNKARALSLGNLAVLDALEALDDANPPGDTPAGVGNGYYPPATQHALPPPTWQITRYAIRQFALFSGLVVRKYWRSDTVWCVALTHGANSGFLPKTLLPPRGRFFADPFVYTHQGQPYIFFEDYSFKEKVGKISAAVCKNGEFEFLGRVLDLPYHLSFPYLFEYLGTLYMVPETCGNRTIELWRCVDFPMRWERDRTLMSDLSAVDTILFPYENRWWMFSNIDRTNNNNHSDELFAFYADSPTSTDWTPHALNPIVRDPAKARNGGVIMAENGDILRCAQYQGFCHYGKGMSLNRITELTPDSYREENGAINYPDFVREPHSSMHHCHRHGAFTVFDFGFRK